MKIKKNGGNMNGKELIEMVKEYKLEDFEIIFRTEDGLRDFPIDKVPLDIEYSDKKVLLTGTERLNR
jgi:hypothetical protein